MVLCNDITLHRSVKDLVSEPEQACCALQDGKIVDLSLCLVIITVPDGDIVGIDFLDLCKAGPLDGSGAERI